MRLRIPRLAVPRVLGDPYSTLQACHWFYGLHSNIPRCCVWEYVQMPDERRYLVNRAKAHRLAEWNRHLHYVACDACIEAILKGHAEVIQPLHECTVECVGYQRTVCRW